MFEASILAGRLQGSLQAVRAVTHESVVRLEEDGLAVQAVDPATVVMVDLELATEAFEAYAATGVRIGVNIGRFDDVLGLVSPGQPVDLELQQDTQTLQAGFHVVINDPLTDPSDSILVKLHFTR